MGGYSSGRYRERNRGTVDAAIRLDLRVMRRQGFLVPGAVTSGVQRWTRTATGEETGSVSVTVNLADPDAGFVVVRFSLNGDPRVQEIPLASRAMRYGVPDKWSRSQGTIEGARVRIAHSIGPMARKAAENGAGGISGVSAVA